MQLKFCVNLNEILEVIRFLVMTVFFCHLLHTFEATSNCCAFRHVFAYISGDKSRSPFRFRVSIWNECNPKYFGNFHLYENQARRQDLVAGGPKARRRGQNPKGGPHF